MLITSSKACTAEGDYSIVKRILGVHGVPARIILCVVAVGFFLRILAQYIRQEIVREIVKK